MGKFKSLIICAAALCCPIFICTGSSAGSTLRSAAYFAAGASPDIKGKAPSTGSSVIGSSDDTKLPNSTIDSGPNLPLDSDPFSDPNSEINVNKPLQTARVIEKNRTEFVDDTDLSQYTKRNGKIYRYAFDKYLATTYINLESGAQVRNLTDKPNSLVEAVSKQLPDIHISDPGAPTVLIYHTHTTESFMPEGDTFDKDYPNRSRDNTCNMVAVGDALCKALEERGVSVVHDCTVHDYPQYVGAYDRSAETILQNLEEYPSIKIVIDIHRDGIVNADGSLVAPVVEIDGKNAAQFMIISGCDCDTYSIPHYLENLKLACLLQNISESKYPNLARSVLFDYRDYNQSLFAGTLLIEVGSHGNSLNEVVYTGELLGDIIAQAVKTLS